MSTLALSTYLDSEFGVALALPRAGSALEHPLVFDATARELKAMAERGLIEILDEHSARDDGDGLIDRLSFKRLR